MYTEKILPPPPLPRLFFFLPIDLQALVIPRGGYRGACPVAGALCWAVPARATAGVVLVGGYSGGCGRTYHCPQCSAPEDGGCDGGRVGVVVGVGVVETRVVSTLNYRRGRRSSYQS